MDFAEWCLVIALTGFVELIVVSVWIWLSRAKRGGARQSQQISKRPRSVNVPD
jgi:hypothetical protein